MTAPREVPPLVQVAPDCPVCWDSVTHDGDGWACKPCGFRWSVAAYDVTGTATGEQCPAEVAPYVDTASSITGCRYRCIRRAGHDADGRNVLARHVGMPSGENQEADGEPYEWVDGEYPQVEHAAGAA